MSAFDSFFDDDDYVVNMSHQNGNWVVTKKHSEWKNLGFRYFQDLPGNQQVYDLEATLFPEYQHIWKSVLSVPIDNTDDMVVFLQIFTDEKEIDIFIQILYYLHVLNFDCYFDILDMENPKHVRFMWLLSDKPYKIYNSIEDNFDLIQQVINLTIGNNIDILQRRLQMMYVSSQRDWFMIEGLGHIDEHERKFQISIGDSEEYNDSMRWIFEHPNIVIAGSYPYLLINDLPFPDQSDMDIFILNKDLSIIRKIIQHFRDHDNSVVITKLGTSVACINSPHLSRTIQLIITNYKVPQHIVLNFDLPCCQWFIYMDKAFSSKAARHAHKHKFVYIGHSIVLASRQIKYLNRGFKLFGNDERLIDSSKLISFVSDTTVPFKKHKLEMDVENEKIIPANEKVHLVKFEFGGSYNSKLTETRYEMKDVIIPYSNRRKFKRRHSSYDEQDIYINMNNPNHVSLIEVETNEDNQAYIEVLFKYQTKVYLNGERVKFQNLNFPCKANIVFCKIKYREHDWVPYIIRVNDDTDISISSEK